METKILWQRVATWREADVEAKWGRHYGTPVMFVQPSQSKNFYMLNKNNLQIIQACVNDGSTLRDAVDTVFAVADIFHI